MRTDHLSFSPIFDIRMKIFIVFIFLVGLAMSLVKYKPYIKGYIDTALSYIM